jgi:hypothetical protein
MEVAGLTYRGSDITDHEILDELPGEYCFFLQQTNGCVLFNGGLYIRGAVESPEWHSLRNVWHGGLKLSRLFPAVEDSDVPFAQDCFGDQFLLRSGLVHRLHAEFGEVESLRMGFENFIDRAHENPIEFLSLQPLHGFLSDGGELKLGQLLNVNPPFVIRESANGVSLRAIPMVEQISFLADFSGQIADVPNGGRIEIKVINIPDGES